MAIYRGPGGSGDAVNDSSSEASAAVIAAANAASSASAASASATAAAASATAAAASAETINTANFVQTSAIGVSVQAYDADLTAFAAKTAPSGAVVGTTDTQTLTNKTLTSPVISTISNTGTVTLPTATDTLVGRATTDTLTNKRVTPRVLASTANSATPTLNTDSYDMMVITGQSVAITSFTTNLSGTPTNGQKLWIAITGTTAIAITWGASFESSTVSLPSTTVTTNRLDIGFVYNSATSKWRCVASA